MTPFSGDFAEPVASCQPGADFQRDRTGQVVDGQVIVTGRHGLAIPVPHGGGQLDGSSNQGSVAESGATTTVAGTRGSVPHPAT